ncbi:F-box domain-containing protein [Favolaschia claudopus]|uniref:F-box domain-containing protein n=1 Tax=Favolaschia claudopus TaxID=2862362 RepID=A0AAW0C405_9AGAR
MSLDCPKHTKNSNLSLRSKRCSESSTFRPTFGNRGKEPFVSIEKDTRKRDLFAALSGLAESPPRFFPFVTEIRCGFDPTEYDEAAGLSRVELRSRLTELDALIASLTLKRQSLQAASDAIIYPVLSLPLEITAEIFVRCLPAATYVSPSISDAPLLLTQVCHQWREIALGTPTLWQSLAFKDQDVSTKLLTLWLSRSGVLPISLSVTCWDKLRTGALFAAALQFVDRWCDMKFGLPLSSFSKLDLRNEPLPNLRTLRLDYVSQSSDDIVSDIVSISHAVALREAYVTTHPEVIVDLPWAQLTALTLKKGVELHAALTLLETCTNLVTLDISTADDSIASSMLVTMDSVKTLTCNLGSSEPDSSCILDHVILPNLTRLSVQNLSHPRHAPTLKNFIHRSACSFQFFAASFSRDMTADTFLECLRVLPDSISELELTSPRGEFTRGIFSTLAPDTVLPRLRTLRLHGRGVLSDDEYEDLVDMVQVRRARSPPSLDLVSLHLWLFSNHPRMMPSNLRIVQLKALTSRFSGLKIKFLLSKRVPYGRSTHVVLDNTDSGEILLVCLVDVTKARRTDIPCTDTSTQRESGRNAGAGCGTTC